MKKTIYCLIIALFAAVSAHAAGPKKFYEYPDVTTLPDAGRVLLWDGSADKNITGATIKQEAVNAVNAPSDAPLIKQPATNTNPAQRVFEVRDSTGKITMYMTADGTMVFGTPVEE